MRLRMNIFTAIACVLAAALLAACGGGGFGGVAATDTTPAQIAQSSSAGPSSLAGSNALPVVVDAGPGIFFFTGRKVLNMLYASVTLCTPGSTTACETIDHVQVDTGSVGLRILAPALTGKAAMAASTEPVSGSPLRQCAQFADGYTWGSVVTADVKMAGQVLASLPVNLIADPAAGTAPPSCVSGPAKNTVNLFGANGVLGIGSFVRDCGSACVGDAVSGMYYVCPDAGTGSLCRSTAVPLDHQLLNPVAALGSDNNGVTIDIPPVPAAGVAMATGTVYFGVDTQSNNAVGDARFFTVDSIGTLQTSYGGQLLRAVIDAGSNGYFFTTSSMATCTKNKAFYCPALGGVPTSSPETAAIVGRNGLSQTVGFTVDNVDQLFTGVQAALPGAAAPGSGLVGGAASVFSWGLPFFYGRPVHVLLEGQTVAGVTGPAIGF